MLKRMFSGVGGSVKSHDMDHKLRVQDFDLLKVNVFHFDLLGLWGDFPLIPFFFCEMCARTQTPPIPSSTARDP
jgi:hypothetical protein